MKVGGDAVTADGYSSKGFIPVVGWYGYPSV